MTKQDIIQQLRLEPHPTEGGYFRRTYESDVTIETPYANRRLLTSIYYMLTDDSSHGYLHRNKSDILHYHHLGSPIQYLIISPNGRVREALLGSDIANGEQPQLIVRGGEWKISQLHHGDYGLLSEAVAPGFEYEDNEIASRDMVEELFPQLLPRVEKYIKPVL